MCLLFSWQALNSSIIAMPCELILLVSLFSWASSSSQKVLAVTQMTGLLARAGPLINQSSYSGTVGNWDGAMGLMLCQC